MADNEQQQAGKQYKYSPYDFFKNTAHEIITQDAAFQLIKPGTSFREILAKTNIQDRDFLNRVVQFKEKLEEYGLGENAWPPWNQSMEMLKDLLVGLTSIEGFGRAEFSMALSRLIAPALWELKKTGKISGSKSAKQLGVLKAREQKESEGKEQ